MTIITIVSVIFVVIVIIIIVTIVSSSLSLSSLIKVILVVSLLFILLIIITIIVIITFIAIFIVIIIIIIFVVNYSMANSYCRSSVIIISQRIKWWCMKVSMFAKILQAYDLRFLSIAYVHNTSAPCCLDSVALVRQHISWFYQSYSDTKFSLHIYSRCD